MKLRALTITGLVWFVASGCSRATPQLTVHDGKACLDGVVSTLASIGNSEGLVVDESYVYWANYNKTLNRVAKVGGIPEELGSTGGFVQGFAADATDLYWGIGNDGNGGVFKMSKSGGDPTRIAEGDSCCAVGVDDDSVYWSAAEAPTGGDGQPGFCCALMKVAKGGGDPVVLLPYGKAPKNGPFLFDDASIYWSDNVINKLSKAGGTPVVLADEAVFGYFSIMGGQIFTISGTLTESVDDIVSKATATIWELPTSGGTPTQLVFTPDGVLGPLLVDSTSLYYGSGTLADGIKQILRAELDGTQPSLVASVPASISDLAQDDRCLYFVTNDETLNVIAKPPAP